MRRLLEIAVVLVLAISAADHLGCACTDYAEMPLAPPLNKSHGIVSCATDDRIANAQQTIEPATRGLVRPVIDPATGRTQCFGIGPSQQGSWIEPSGEAVSPEDARDWNRFLGAFTYQSEFQVENFPGFEGNWLSCGLKDLPDGSRRLNSFYYPLQPGGAMSCVSRIVEGALGGAPEGVVYSEGVSVPGHPARLPGLRLDTIAVDSRPGLQWCENVVAMHPESHANQPTFSYWASLSRAQEYRLESTPITRREGLAQFLAGGELTVQWEDVRLVARGEILADGRVACSLLRAERAEAIYEAVHPMRVIVQPSSTLRALTVDVGDHVEEAEAFARFLVQADLTDHEIRLGQFVPELGVQLPDASILLVGESWRRLAGGQSR